MPRSRNFKIALITALVVVAGFGGYAISQLTAYSYANYAGKYTPKSGNWPGSYGSDSPGMGSMGSMTSPPSPDGVGASAQFSSTALAERISKQVGSRLAGRAPQTVSTAQTKTLSEQVPTGASIDRATHTITFTSSAVSFTVVAIPPYGPDMTFGIAGMNNPTVIVPRGARVTVQFINADSNEAHGWIVTTHEPPFTFGQTVIPAITGAFAGVLGNPTATGNGAETVTFQADNIGNYQYLCPMPGHAQMGMHGAFVVR